MGSVQDSKIVKEFKQFIEQDEEAFIDLTGGDFVNGDKIFKRRTARR